MKFLVPLVLFLLGASAWANPKLDALFRDYDKPGVPGAAVTIIQCGQVAYRKAYGLARVKDGAKATPETNFRLASLAKQFTAMAVLILVDRGQLHLDDKLTEIFPDFPAYGKNITIAHLLHHQSGLPDYEEHVSGSGQVSDAGVLAILKSQSHLDFTPGSRYRYSNAGYCVLSNIVAKVSGRTFPAFVREEIFGPLVMPSSLVYVKDGPAIPNRAYGHTGTSETDQSATSATLGDGGVYTNVEDWFQWDQALYHNPLISPALQALAFTPGTLADGSPTSYGFGWVIDTYRGHRRQSHTGSSIGFRTAVSRFPDEELSIVVLVNRASATPWDTAREIADLYLP